MPWLQILDLSLAILFHFRYVNATSKI